MRVPEPIADLIDAHRPTGRWVGDGVRVECTCGHLSHGEPPDGPQDDENNAHRDADRKHAQHMADVLRAEHEPIMGRTSTHSPRELNAVAGVVDSLGLSGWVPLSVRYGAAERILDALADIREKP